ncbi:FAS1-like dehydratase domain-containing protein [Domibacillus iocasae]|nr:MaoC family dehydratase N-terminal domain-containing protein [Domibacillus iocasae]
MKEKVELYRYVYKIEEKEVNTFKQAVFASDSIREIPPTFATVMDFQGGMSFYKLTELLHYDPACVLHGSQSYEYIKPVYPGDQIEAIIYITGKTTKKNMTFAKLETTYIKENETTIISRSVLIEQKGDRHV